MSRAMAALAYCAALTIAGSISASASTAIDSNRADFPMFKLEAHFSVSEVDPEVQYLAWNPAGNELATLAPILRYVKVFAIPSLQEIAKAEDIAGGAQTINFVGAERLAIPSYRSPVAALSLWDFRKGDFTGIAGPASQYPLPSANHLFNFSVSQSGNRLAGLHKVPKGQGIEIHLAVYDTSNWALIADYPVNATVIALSRNGRMAAWNRGRGEIDIAETDTGTVVRRLTMAGSSVRQIEWSPADKFIAAGVVSPSRGGDPSPESRPALDGGAALQIWDVQTGELVGHSREPLGGGVESISFDPDGRLLASTTADGTLRLWNMPALTQAELVAEGLHPNTAIVRFSSDGSRIAVAKTGLGEVLIYARVGALHGQR